MGPWAGACARWTSLTALHAHQPQDPLLLLLVLELVLLRRPCQAVVEVVALPTWRTFEWIEGRVGDYLEGGARASAQLNPQPLCCVVLYTARMLQTQRLRHCSFGDPERVLRRCLCLHGAEPGRGSSSREG